MRTLRQEGVRKVLAGLTTPAEVVRVTQGYHELSGVAAGEG
jgi:type II secretory ATPase GspE/PulE/Tfp pilus assembly ATPase PilB-like protein